MRGLRAGAGPGLTAVKQLKRRTEAYLDNAATTRPHAAVVAAVVEAMRGAFGNPSSPHALGLEAERAVKAAREAVAALLGAHPDQVVFTSGGTEAINTALKGIAAAYRREGRHAVTAAAEHPATLAAMRHLEEDGFEVTVLPVDGQGLVDPAAVRAALRPDTLLASFMLVNNEVGSVQPVAGIAAAVREHRQATGRPCFLHVDAVQAVGRLPVSFAQLGADLLSLSGHKFHGPKGVGALVVGEGVRFRPLLAGGGQEGGRRSGTENVPGIVGLGKAAKLAAGWVAAGPSELRALRGRLVAGIRERFPDARLLGPDDERAAPHIASFVFPGLPGEVAVRALGARGVYVSTGSACSTRKPDPSHVLLAMGLAPGEVRSALRFSLSPMTEEREIDTALAVLEPVVAELRALARR